jgi:hypothetical protein
MPRREDDRLQPALYFVERGGVIRDQDFGEGRYEESDCVPEVSLLASRSEAPEICLVPASIAHLAALMGVPGMTGFLFTRRAPG